jgi:hypothetical protein
MPSAPPPRVPSPVSGSLCQALASTDQSVAVRRIGSQSLNLNRALLGDKPNREGHSPQLRPTHPSKN